MNKGPKNRDKERSKEVKSDNFCYIKFGRGITKWGALEKSIEKFHNLNLSNKLLFL